MSSQRCFGFGFIVGLVGACAPDLERMASGAGFERAPAAVEACGEDDASASGETPRIHQIQGRSHVSPWLGRTVRDVPGIVTRTESNGFYLQDPEPDDSDCTSEGIFVFTSNAPAAGAGDRVEVSGEIHEYREGCASCAASEPAYARLSRTEIAGGVVVEIVARDEPLPEPIVIGGRGRVVPHVIEDDAEGDVEIAGVRFDPARDALDFYESLEGMRVELLAPEVVGPARGTNPATVIPEWPNDALRSARGALVASPESRDASRLALVAETRLALEVGDGFTGPLRGILDTRGGRPLLLADALPDVRPARLERERLSLGSPAASELTVATLNVRNLSVKAPSATFASLATLIVDQLNAPDLLALQEIQDDSGTLDDGTLGAELTLETLARAIERAGGPSYSWIAIDPLDGKDGGAPGGNIRVVLLIRGDRGLSFTRRGQATATTRNRILGSAGEPRLEHNPGRVEPSHPAFEHTRKSLGVELEFGGVRLFTLVNHWSSKLGDPPEFGRFQPPPSPTETQRLAQASVVADFVAELLERDSAARVLVLGDLNDHPFSDALAVLGSVGLESALDRLPPEERYTYVFEGKAQAIDHVFASPELAARMTGVDVVHAHAEFADAVTDHDPVVARFDFARP